MSRFTYIVYALFILVIFTKMNIDETEDDGHRYNYNGRSGSFSGGHK